MCRAVQPTAPDPPKLGIHDTSFAWYCMPSSGPMLGWLTQAKYCLQKLPKDLHSTSHYVPRPTGTAGLPTLFKGRQSFRAKVALGGPGQLVRILLGKGKPRGSTPINGALRKKQYKGCQKGPIFDVFPCQHSTSAGGHHGWGI
eukprot:scaffold263659_cov17-Tisochrysis_lutea.AAC.1